MTNIENAVSNLTANELKEYIKYLQVHKSTKAINWDYAFKIFQAIDEQAEREKGCSFCNDKRVVSFCATSYHSSLEPITIIEDLYFGFCPHCGRKLNSSPTGSL